MAREVATENAVAIAMQSVTPFTRGALALAGRSCRSARQELIWLRNLATMFHVKRVKIGEFRDRASELIRRAASGETIVILNRDREVAKIVPIAAKRARGEGLVGSLAGTATVRGDIEAPIASADAWFQDPR
jgi:prevent-host-death family protein